MAAFCGSGRKFSGHEPIWSIPELAGTDLETLPGKAAECEGSVNRSPEWGSWPDSRARRSLPESTETRPGRNRWLTAPDLAFHTCYRRREAPLEKRRNVPMEAWSDSPFPPTLAPVRARTKGPASGQGRDPDSEIPQLPAPARGAKRASNILVTFEDYAQVTRFQRRAT